MNRLTFLEGDRMIDSAGANSPVGIATPYFSGVQDAPHGISVFFCACPLWWTGFGRLSSLAVSLRSGCCNLNQFATLIRLQPICGELQLISQEFYAMCIRASNFSPFTPEDCFTVSSSELAHKPFPTDPVAVGTSRALALLRLLMSSSDGDAENGSFSISHADVMNNLWLLEMALGQVEQLIEGWCNGDSINQKGVNHV